MENRFSTMTEVRTVVWPAYETPEYSAAQFLQGIAGTLELFHRSTLSFQKIAGKVTGHPVAVFQRIDQAGYKLPIDERILADTDTLLVFGLDHLLSEQEAAPDEVASIAACVALVGMLWEVLGMTVAPEPAWWLDAFVSRTPLLEGEAQLRPRHPGLAFNGPLWRLVDTQVRRALEEQLSVRVACDRWYSGAYLLETVPSTLYILARHSQDPEVAVMRAVSDTKDNDTIAAIVGAAVGALHGRRAFSSRWADGLLARLSQLGLGKDDFRGCEG
jgi:ADP-ribosylglycohydrolase